MKNPTKKKKADFTLQTDHACSIKKKGLNKEQWIYQIIDVVFPMAKRMKPHERTKTEKY